MATKPKTATTPTTKASGQTRFGRRYQTNVLASRYARVLWGDKATLLLLLGQAPLIGWLCTLVWNTGRATPSLYFVLCLASIWFGCINACREIVKERNIVERERFFGLSMASYVASKFMILAVLGLAQVLLLQIAVQWEVALKGPFLLHSLALWGACWCGIALGLLVSAFARRQERAVGAIPLILMPQILFSEMVIPKEAFSDLVSFLEKLQPVSWSWRVCEQLSGTDTSGWEVLGSLLVLVAFGGLLLALVILTMLRRRET